MAEVRMAGRICVAVQSGGAARGRAAARPAADAEVVSGRIAAAGCGEGVEGGAVVAVVGEGDGARDARGSWSYVLGAGEVGGGDDGEDAAGLGGEFNVAGVGEVEAVVAGRGDEDDVGLGGGIGDAVEGGEEAGAVSGGEVGSGADGEADDVGSVGDGVFDALHDPAEETAGFAGCALLRGSAGAGDGGGHALEHFDVKDGGGGGY